MSAAVGDRYDDGMERSAVPSVISPFARLFAAFGDRLEVVRADASVCWTLEGRSAVATMRCDGAVDAAFLDRPVFDAATHRRLAPVYGRPQARYGLDPVGAARMVDDICAFFGGAREPHFAFVAIEERHPLR